MSHTDANPQGQRNPEVSLTRGTLLGLRADVVMAVSAVVTSIVVSRALGPEARGVFFLAVVATTIVVVVGDMGLSTAGIVYSANRRLSPSQLHGVALFFSLVAGVVGAVTFIPFEGFWTSTVLKGLDTNIFVLLSLGVSPLLYVQIMGAVITGLGAIPVISAMRVGTAIATPLVMVPAVTIGGTAAWGVGAFLATTLGFSVAIMTYMLRRGERPERPSRGTLRTIFSFGTRGYVGSMAHQGFLRIDVLFISARYGPSTVGLYSLASVFAERISMLGQAIYGASAAPMGASGADDGAELTARIVRLLLSVMIPVAVVGALAAGPGFPILFGDDFSSAALPFILLLPGTVGLTLWYVVGLYIISALERPGTTTMIQGAALIVSLPLYYLAVREWAMTGAAVVASATYLSVLVAGVAVLLANSRVRLRDLRPGREEGAKLLHFARSLAARRAHA